MTILKEQHTTGIEIFNVKFDLGLDDQLFLLAGLGSPKVEEKVDIQ